MNRMYTVTTRNFLNKTSASMTFFKIFLLFFGIINMSFLNCSQFASLVVSPLVITVASRLADGVTSYYTMNHMKNKNITEDALPRNILDGNNLNPEQRRNALHTNNFEEFRTKYTWIYTLAFSGICMLTNQTHIIPALLYNQITTPKYVLDVFDKDSFKKEIAITYAISLPFFFFKPQLSKITSTLFFNSRFFLELSYRSIFEYPISLLTRDKLSPS